MCRETLPNLGRFVWMPIAMVAVFASDLTAQLTDSVKAQLVAEIDSAGQSWDVERFPDWEASKQRAAERMGEASQFLASRATPAGRDAWLAYLDLEPLQQAIESQQGVPAIQKEAIALRYRLIGTSPGLEQQALRQLRDSVEGVIAASRFADIEKSKRGISSLLTALSQRVSVLEDVPSSSDIAWITARVGLIDSSGQAEAAVASLRETFSQPNVAVLIGEPLIQDIIHQDIAQSQPVRDCILGTRIIGTATMDGEVSATLLPTVDSARIQLSLTGHITSRNMGYNGPIRFRSLSHGDVNVSRTLHLDDSGIRLDVTNAEAKLTTDIGPIQHPLRLVRKIATKRSRQQKPQAERIAVRRMRSRVGEEFTAKTNQAISASPSESTPQLRTLMRRLSLHEPAQRWRTTDDLLSVNATFRGPAQLSTVVPPPSIDASFDAAIQLHESVINNVCSPVLAGRTMNEDQVNRLLEEGGRPPSDGSVSSTAEADTSTAATGGDEENSQPEPPFEIEFASVQPIVFAARDQTVRIGIRGTRFAKGRRELKRSMEITAVYRAKTVDGKTVLARDGDVDVNFPGGKRLTVSQAGLKPTIKKSFAKVFPPTLFDRPLEVPSSSAVDQLRGRVFHPQFLDASDGWLTITIH